MNSCLLVEADVQVSQAREAVSREARLKEQLREQLATAAADSKRQVGSHSNDSLANHTFGVCQHHLTMAHDEAPS